MQYKIPSRVTEIILESISDGVFTVDHEWRITSFNRAAEMITGIQRNEALGKHCWEVFRSRMCETDCSLRRTMKQGKPFVDTATYIVNSQTRRVPVRGIGDVPRIYGLYIRVYLIHGCHASKNPHRRHYSPAPQHGEGE